MKKDIHPTYNKIDVTCTTCGNVFQTGSVKDEVRVDTCSNCHPFYTGEQKFGKTAGQVDKFNQRYNKAKK